MSLVNKARLLVQHESWEYKCGYNENVCKSKQKWNPVECRCECKELEDWVSFEKGYMRNPCTFYFKYTKACKIDEFLDIKIWSCEKRLIFRSSI